jgi:hypothetical protein
MLTCMLICTLTSRLPLPGVILRKWFVYDLAFTFRIEKNLGKQTGLAKRYYLFFSNPKKLFENPFLGLSMLFMKTCEFGVGGAGYLMGKLRGHEKLT